MQSFRVITRRGWADRLIWATMPAHHDRLAALAADLGRLASLAEAEPAGLSLAGRSQSGRQSVRPVANPAEVSLGSAGPSACSG